MGLLVPSDQNVPIWDTILHKIYLLYSKTAKKYKFFSSFQLLRDPLPSPSYSPSSRCYFLETSIFPLIVAVSLSTSFISLIKQFSTSSQFYIRPYLRWYIDGLESPHPRKVSNFSRYIFHVQIGSIDCQVLKDRGVVG